MRIYNNQHLNTYQKGTSHLVHQYVGRTLISEIRDPQRKDPQWMAAGGPRLMNLMIVTVRRLFLDTGCPENTLVYSFLLL